MSKRTNALMVIMVMALLFIFSISITLYSSNLQLNSDHKESTDRLQMNYIIQKGQMAVERGFEKVRNLTHDLALRLRETGLNGTEAREEINQTLALNPQAIDVLTFDAHGIVQAVEPARYGYLEVWT